MKPRVYDEYIMLARVTAPSYRVEPGAEDPIPVITAIDDRFFPRQWDADAALYADVAGDNLVGELPNGLDRRKDWGFAAYIKRSADGNPVIVGLDAMPSRVYRKSILPSATKDLKNLVVNWSTSGLVEVIARPPLVRFETQARLLRTINDLYLAKGKKLSAGMRINTGRRDIGKIVRVSDGEIEISPSDKATSGKPVYAAGDDEQ